MASKVVLATILLAILCNARADLINDVCSKTNIPNLCNTALRSDPSSRGADLRGLGLIIAKNAISVTIAAEKVAESLVNGPNKGAASACVFFCKDAFVFLNTCPDFLRINQPNLIVALKNAVARALNDLRTCDAKFGGGEPINLKSNTKLAQDYSNILLVIANLL